MAALLALIAALAAGCTASRVASSDPLPSWAEGAARSAIVQFVEDVTDPASPHYVQPQERIATFDNDGCLWVEQPTYTQLTFAIDRVRALAPEHPEWETTQPFKAVLQGDMESLKASGMHGLMEIVIATHSGMTADEFEDTVVEWLAASEHPRFERPYTECVYLPQLELLVYLREHGFRTFVVSGGGAQFVRAWSEAVYGIPPEQVIGSRVVTEYVGPDDGGPALVRRPEIGFIDDKAGKPVGIHEHIGRRPILAFGNSDGDLQMLEYTTAGDGRRLGLLLHHTDAEREYAYDRDSLVGRLDEALDRAGDDGWIIVDMKRDWTAVFPEPDR